MKALLTFLVAASVFCADTMADEEARRIVAESTRGFADNFLKEVAEAQPGNLICSPLSAQVVLAMAAYGAGSTTATQMRSTLLIPSDDELGKSGYKSLIETLNTVKGVQLRLVNKIWTSNNFQVKPAYKELTASKFLSTSQEVDFNNPVATASLINSWCAEQTNDRIKDIVTPDSLDANTAMLLANAVYFKGKWAKKFDPALTIDRPFHVDARTIKNVPTMYNKLNGRFGDLPELDARFIELIYEGGEVSMIIILPNEINGLKRVQENLHRVNLTERLRRTYPNEVEVYLPRFKIETTMDLQAPLEKLGMTTMFQDGADFSNIADRSIKVSKVIQKAFIEVNEEGSEAAAVTVVGVYATSAFFPEPQRQIFAVDHPAYYEIYHRNYDLALFTGAVHQPIAS